MTALILAWLVLGLVAGLVAGTVVYGAGRGPLANVGIGIGGALVGGWIFSAFGLPGFDGLNIYSLLVATTGATLLMVVFRAFSRIFR